jgi:hypothetical protein
MSNTNGKAARSGRGQAIRDHVRSMLNVLRDRNPVREKSVDHTVEVDREKDRTKGVNGI